MASYAPGSLLREFLSWQKAGFSLRAARIIAQDITAAVATGTDRAIARAIGLDHLRRLGLFPERAQVSPPPVQQPPLPAPAARPQPASIRRSRGYKPPSDFCLYPTTPVATPVQRRYVTGFLTHVENIPTAPRASTERGQAAALLNSIEDETPTEQYPAIVATLHGRIRP